MDNLIDDFAKINSLDDPTNVNRNSSRLPGFHQLPLNERVEVVAKSSGLTPAEAKQLSGEDGLNGHLTDIFIENAIGNIALPLGVATNFKVNGKDVLVPMAVEETSVLAAASHGAKLVRLGGGFQATSTEPIMTGQIQLFIDKPEYCEKELIENSEALIAFANKGHQNLVNRGGGAKEITWRYIKEIKSMIVHLHINTCDAMGANIVNTMCEKVSVMLQELFQCEVGLRILTNLSDRRLTKVTCRVPKTAFESKEFRGSEVVNKMISAYQFAYYDIYRAATNNKGVMNGIDPVVIATGNDWRAVEAGAHAWCCRSGKYRPMAKWSKDHNGDLIGEIELPMSVGTVGGVTKLHPTAKAAMKLLGSPNATELAEIICAVGLAQNLSALRALASEGIQRGHMSLHKRNLDLLIRKGATRS